MSRRIKQTLAPLLKRGNDWFEILKRLFASHLLEEWQRGAHRTHQMVEDELSVLKGKWRMTDQIRSPVRRHTFSVAYDQFTADNPLNRIFRFVVERLWYQTRDGGNRRSPGALRLRRINCVCRNESGRGGEAPRSHDLFQFDAAINHVGARLLG